VNETKPIAKGTERVLGFFVAYSSKARKAPRGKKKNLSASPPSRTDGVRLARTLKGAAGLIADELRDRQHRKNG